MNKQEKYMDDLLKQYIIPERIEKAPDGFTAKVMTRVQLDSVAEKAHVTNLVPVISIAVIVSFFAAAFFLTDSQTDKYTQIISNLMSNMANTNPFTNLSSILKLSLPSVTLWVLIGILALTFFDKALHGIFRKEK